MKIAILSDSFYPIIDGVVRFVDRLAMVLHKEGFEVTLIIPRYFRQAEKYYTNRPYKFHFLPTLPVKVRGYYPALPSPSLYYELKETDLIIINSLAFTAAYSLVFNRLLHKKVIEFVHADERVVMKAASEVPQFLINQVVNLMKKMTSQINYFAVATNTFEKRTLEYGASPRSIFRVPFGYSARSVSDNEINKVYTTYNLDRDKITILYLGRLSDEKNIDTIVEVMAHLTNQNKGVQALIAGGGYRYHSLKKYIKEKDYQIILTGRIPDNVLPPLYMIADIFYSPSNHEALCFTVIEAMSYCTIPAINAKFKENELDEKNSVAIPDIYDIDGTVDLLQTLINKKERMVMLKKGVQTTSTIFTWERFQHAWIRKIEKIMS